MNLAIKPATQPAQIQPSTNGRVVLSVSELAKKLPRHELPRRMMVAVDGCPNTGKFRIGELLAEAIGAVLVDSGRFYRALALACLDDGVNLTDEAEIADYCRECSMDVRRTRDGGLVQEAQVSINGRWFTKEQLRSVDAETVLVASVFEVRQILAVPLRLCHCFGRVVMVGRDIGANVVKDTPFKFFLGAPEYFRDQERFGGIAIRSAIRSGLEDPARAVYAEDALMIDTRTLKPDEVSGIILLELFWRIVERKSLRVTV